MRRKDFDRNSVFIRPFDRQPDLIRITSLHNTADMKTGNVTNAEAFPDDTTKITHSRSPFRGL
jgi:hypothetical protein